MARTPKYWLKVINDEKQTRAQLNVYQPDINDAQEFLDQLTTTSKVSVWQSIFWCCAVCAYALDAVFDLFKTDLDNIAAKSRYGTLPWYVSISKEYQHGDTLVLIDYEWKYAADNLPARIVTLAAANEAEGQVNVKVAKLVSDAPAPLSAPEEAAFTAYLKKRRPAGVYVSVINSPADEIRLFISVNFDPLVLTATGELIATPGVFPVEDAVTAYRTSLDFDGRFELMKLIDAVQNAIGVTSAYVTLAEARYGANPFAAFTQHYTPNAGYLVIDPLTPLTDSISYTADV